MDLYVFVMIISLVCVLGFFNEKLTKLNYGISLILLSTLIGLLAIGASVVFKNNTDTLSLLNNIQTLDIDESVMKGSLCFILFAASCHMDLASFKSQAKRLVILSLVCTLLCAGIFGGLFYGASILLGIGIPLPVCLLFGSIVASTDPIASAGIVSKFKFPKNISTLLRGEALFNSIVSAILAAVAKRFLPSILVVFSTQPRPSIACSTCLETAPSPPMMYTSSSLAQ